jgi:hypothetical protein
VGERWLTFQGSWNCSSSAQAIAFKVGNEGKTTPQNGGHYTHDDKTHNIGDQNVQQHSFEVRLSSK